MKTFIFLAILSATNLSFAQTRIIANKSHSGTVESLAAEKDGNFGIEPKYIDSVIKISDKCIIEINNYGWRDTVHNHPYFLKPGITLEEMKVAYPGIKFIGFEKNRFKVNLPNPNRKQEKKGTLYLMALLMAGTVIYTFKPFRKNK